MDRLLSNTSWIIFKQIFQMVVGFFVGLYAVRYLGPSNYGLITYVGSYITFFSALCLMGLDTVVVNRLVHHKDKDGEIIASAIFLRSIMALISMTCLTLLIMTVDHGDKTLLIIAVISGFELFFKAFGTIGFWYQYKLLSKYTVIADTIAFAFATAYRIYLLATGKSVYWFAFYNVSLYILITILYVPLFKRDCQSKIVISKSMCKELLQACVPYLLSGVLISLYSQVDRVMIKHMLNSATEVGYYSLAATICNLIAFVPQSISASARPVLMDMRKSNSKEYTKRFRQVLATIMWFSCGYAICISVFSKQIISMLYGSQYLPSAKPLSILVWVTIVENLTMLRDMWLIGENQSRFVTLFSCAGTIVNITLNFMLIPRFGIVGAAVATVVTQFAVTLLVPIMFKETRAYSVNVFNAMILRGVNTKELVREVKGALHIGGKHD